MELQSIRQKGPETEVRREGTLLDLRRYPRPALEGNRGMNGFSVGDDRLVVLVKSLETNNRFYTLVKPESGIRNADDVQRMAEMGCDAILVGETFCRLPQNERGAKVKEFVRAGRE